MKGNDFYEGSSAESRLRELREQLEIERAAEESAEDQLMRDSPPSSRSPPRRVPRCARAIACRPAGIRASRQGALHRVPPGAGGRGPATRADLGPRLEGARMRSLGKARSRKRSRSDAPEPNTVMPPFGRHRILEGGEIDRLVEYSMRFRKSLVMFTLAAAFMAGVSNAPEQAKGDMAAALKERLPGTQESEYALGSPPSTRVKRALEENATAGARRSRPARPCGRGSSRTAARWRAASPTAGAALPLPTRSSIRASSAW
jgi:hypothetical protein